MCKVCNKIIDYSVDDIPYEPHILYDDYDKTYALVHNTVYPTVITAMVHDIHYCPFCGERLGGLKY